MAHIGGPCHTCAYSSLTEQADFVCAVRALGREARAVPPSWLFLTGAERALPDRAREDTLPRGRRVYPVPEQILVRFRTDGVLEHTEPQAGVDCVSQPELERVGDDRRDQGVAVVACDLDPRQALQLPDGARERLIERRRKCRARRHGSRTREP